VPRNPFTRLRDRRQPSPPQNPILDEPLRRLAQLREQKPDLAELAATHAALLRAAWHDVPTLPPVALAAAHAATKLQAGVPLLRGEALPLTAADLRVRYARLCDALIDVAARDDDPRRRAALRLRDAVERGAFDVHALTVDVLAGDPGAVAASAAKHDLDAELAATLLRWTLLPLLEQWTRETEPLRQRAQWERGYCPTCGAWPLLAEQRGIEQTRYLRCGLCASSWPTSRVRCPFCDSRAPADLGYLYDEATEATQRALTCERCHHYCKAVASLVPLSPPMLLVTDLATLHLDLIALDRAYMPPQ
jgi:FdhE protein